MSNHDRQFILFGELAPDTVEFDNPTLELARNVTPSYGAYRPIEEAEIVASVQSDDPARGGYCHLSSVGAPDMRVQPIAGGLNAPVMVDNWYTKELVMLDDADVDDYGVDALRGFLANDTTFIRSVPINEPDTLPEIRYRFEEPVRTPTTGTDADVVLRVRLRFVGDNNLGHNLHEVNYVLHDDDTPQDIKTGVFSYDKEEQEFQEFEVELSVAEQAKIADWSKVEIQLTPDSSEQFSDSEENDLPIKDELVEGWETEEGSDEDLWDSINGIVNGGSLPDALHIKSPPIQAGETAVAIFKMDSVETPSDPETGNIACFANFWADQENTSMKVQWIQPASPEEDDPEEEVEDGFITISDVRFSILYEKEIDNISQSSTTKSVISGNLSSEEAYEWVEKYDPEKATYVAFTPAYGGSSTGSGALAAMVPNGDNTTNSWSGTYADVDSCSDGDKTSADSNNMVATGTGYHKVVYAMTNGPARTSTANHKIFVRVKGSDQYVVKLYKGTTLVHSGGLENVPGTSLVWKTINIPGNRIAQHFDKDYDDAKVEIIVTPNSGNFTVNEVFFSYPGDSGVAYVGDTYIDSARGLHAEISLISLDSKNPKNENLGDRNEIYIGTNSKIFEVENGAFTDVSRSAAPYSGAAYGVAGLADISKLWSWTSFGDDVVATNYADEPQYRTFGESQFWDLYDSGAGSEEPYGRHVAVIGAQLVFADINPTSYASGKPFHLWCSKPMAPSFFEAADLDNMSALFALVGKPGAITGLVGGEYGTVFKRNSIWRMTFVGLPIIYQFDLVADGLGCSYPQSIVKAGSDIYFWDSSGIFILAGGQQPQRISGGRIEKLIFDSKFERHSLFSEYGNDVRENDALVWGAYDAYSGLVWWLYRTSNTSQFAMDHMIVFSTVENRFSTLKIDSLDATMLLGRQNVWSNEPVLNRGLLMFNKRTDDIATEHIDAVKFIGDKTNRAKFKSKIITPASWGYEVGRDAEVMNVRAMYKADSEVSGIKASSEPNFQIKIESAQDPSFQNGYQSITVDRNREGRDGWIPIKPQSGEFWRFSVSVPRLYRTTIKEFLGLQLKTRMAGDY